MWGNIASFGVPAILSPLISIVFPGEPFSWERFNSIKLIKDDDESSIVQQEKEDKINSFTPEQLAYMNKTSKISGGLGVFIFLAVWIIVPFGMYGAYYDFSQAFFSGWIVVSIIWLFVAALIITFLPPIEGRHSILNLLKGKHYQDSSNQSVSPAVYDLGEAQKISDESPEGESP